MKIFKEKYNHTIMLKLILVSLLALGANVYTPCSWGQCVHTLLLGPMCTLLALGANVSKMLILLSIKSRSCLGP